MVMIMPSIIVCSVSPARSGLIISTHFNFFKLLLL